MSLGSLAHLTRIHYVCAALLDTACRLEPWWSLDRDTITLKMGSLSLCLDMKRSVRDCGRGGEGDSLLEDIRLSSSKNHWVWLISNQIFAKTHIYFLQIILNQVFYHFDHMYSCKFYRSRKIYYCKLREGIENLQ